MKTKLRSRPSNVALTLTAVMLAVAPLGCGPPAMQRANTRPSLDASAGSARLVIIRPERSGQSNGLSVTFWDGDRLLGQLKGANAMAVNLTPGTHQLAVVSDNIDVVEATVSAGMTYYLYLWVTYTGFSMTTHINPLHPEHEHWGDKEDWLKRCIWIDLVPENAKAIVSRDGSRVRAVLPEFDPAGENSERAILDSYGI